MPLCPRVVQPEAGWNAAPRGVFADRRLRPFALNLLGKTDGCDKSNGKGNLYRNLNIVQGTAMEPPETGPKMWNSLGNAFESRALCLLTFPSG